MKDPTRAPLYALLCAAILVSGQPVQAEPITICGQTVGDGELVGDLDCSTYGDTALILDAPGNGTSTLSLNGFTIDGNVECENPCSITGPGTITGAEGFGVHASGLLTLQSVTLSGNPGTAARGFGITATDCIVSGNGAGLDSGGAAKIYNSTIADNGAVGVRTFALAAHARPLDISDSVVTGNGTEGFSLSAGLRADDGKIRARNCVVSGNIGAGIYAPSSGAFLRESSIEGNTEDGIFAELVRGRDLMIRNNFRGGVSAHRMALTTSTVDANGEHGIFVSKVPHRAQIKDSIIVDNCATSADPACADVITCDGPPRLVDTTCETSRQCSPQLDWGVCSLD